ncbi:MAG: CPBP family intramembrane metalloprotease [Gemmatimonadetes bacterium]|nr:CPBP family intramembrane metalloprotease [Gemmatimonadota bacterium]
MHLELVHFLPIFVLGVVLAYTVERTQSLVPAIVIHGVNNVVAVLTTLYHWNI